MHILTGKTDSNILFLELCYFYKHDMHYTSLHSQFSIRLHVLEQLMLAQRTF